MTAHTIVEVFDVTLLVGGAIVLTLLGWRSVRRRRPLLRGAPLRPNTLDPITVPMLMAVYFFSSGLLQWMLGNWTPATVDAEWADELRYAVLAPMASLIGGAAAIWLGCRSFRAGARGLGFGRRPVVSDLGLAAVAFVSIWPVVFVLHELTVMGIEWVRPEFEPPAHGVIRLLHESQAPPFVLAWLIFGAAVAAPVAEELFFRGIVQTVARNLLRSRWGAIGVTGILFGLVHYSQPQAILPLVVLGWSLGYLYERTGSLVGPIAVHAIFNTRTLIYQLIAPPGTG